jgi:hypothetical protein
MNIRSNGFRSSIPVRACVSGLLLAATMVAPRPSLADALDDLRASLASFRGVGYADVAAYRAAFRLPDDDADEAIALEEMWRAPGDFALRAAEPAAPAVVRSYAIFLEPLYVARTSILDADLDRGLQRLREIGKITTSPSSAGARSVRVELPDPPDSTLPGFLRDVSRIDALLDLRGRLSRLRLELPPARGRRTADSLVVVCTWDDAKAHQPSKCTWTLPDGSEVRVQTTFRDEGGRRVPGTRHVVCPRRYHPGETESSPTEYGRDPWEGAAPLFHAAGTFRYGSEGLLTD